jgi:hypothetical protein
VSEGEIDFSIAAADASASQTAAVATTLKGTVFGLDNLGSPLAEYYTEDQIMAAFGINPSSGSATGK